MSKFTRDLNVKNYVGLDANKPATLGQGDTYRSTDTDQFYRAGADGLLDEVGAGGGGGAAIESTKVVEKGAPVTLTTLADYDVDLAAIAGDTLADTMDNYGFFIDINVGSVSRADVIPWLALHSLSDANVKTGEVDTVAIFVNQDSAEGNIVVDAYENTYVRIRIPVGSLRAGNIPWSVEWGIAEGRKLSVMDVTPVSSPNRTAANNGSNAPIEAIWADANISDSRGGISTDAGGNNMGLTSFTLDSDSSKIRFGLSSTDSVNLVVTDTTLSIKTITVTPFQ